MLHVTYKPAIVDYLQHNYYYNIFWWLKSQWAQNTLKLLTNLMKINQKYENYIENIHAVSLKNKKLEYPCCTCFALMHGSIDTFYLGMAWKQNDDSNQRVYVMTIILL